jgi:cell division septation protein DedD
MSPTKLKDVLVDISGNTNTYINYNENISPRDLNKNDNKKNLKNDNRTLETQPTVKTNKSYRVQVGVYTDYANTLNLVDKLNANFDEPVVVLNGYLNNKTVYKIMAGDFENRKEAENLKNTIVEKIGLKGFVKSFE